MITYNWTACPDLRNFSKKLIPSAWFELLKKYNIVHLVEENNVINENFDIDSE